MKDKALEKQKKFKLNTGTFYGWPMGIWFMIFFVVPLVIILVYSFLKKGVYGGVELKLTLQDQLQKLYFLLT